MTIIIIIHTINSIINIYFYNIDYQWNPLDFEYSQISFKSIRLSSLINIALFVAKPLFGDLMRYLRGIVCHKDNSSTLTAAIVKQAEYQRCATVYKRPYSQWHKLENLEKLDSSTEQMNTILSASNT